MSGWWLLLLAFPWGLSARLAPTRHKGWLLCTVMIAPLLLFLGTFLWFRLSNPGEHDEAYFVMGLVIVSIPYLLWIILALAGFALGRVLKS